VIAHERGLLILEHVAPAARRAGFDDELGRGLAALHRFGARGFGLDHDNYCGRVPQRNEPLPTWAEFYRARRLEPLVRAAADRELLDAALVERFDRLFSKLDDLVGPREPPARLHGDLWGGNLHVDELGAPCLVDPAAYGGHREIDLAMMRLFGGFSPRVFAAYAEAAPLAPGHEGRVALHQLYPLLVHVALFGGAWVGPVGRALSRYE
jgi:fructosamine-3-kinase